MTRANGFTLIEMLVALFVFGLMASAGVLVLAQAVDHQDVVHAHFGALGKLQASRALLRSDLGQVATRRVRNAGGQPARRAFNVVAMPGTGTPLALDFVRRGWRNPDGHPRASMQRVEYRISGGRLERTTHAALDGSVPGEPETLLEGIRGASIRFRHRQAWSSGWPGGAEEVPEAIALTLDIDGLGTVEQVFLLPGNAR